jgi:hypothetical protein
MTLTARAIGLALVCLASLPLALAATAAHSKGACDARYAYCHKPKHPHLPKAGPHTGYCNGTFCYQSNGTPHHHHPRVPKHGPGPVVGR